MAVATWIEREHTVINPVLAGIQAMQRATAKPFSLGFLAAAIAFFGGFLRFHDDKEDHVLIPILAEAGVPVDQARLVTLTRDHAESVRQLAALEAAARTRNAPIASMIGRLASLSATHLAAEQSLLLPAVTRLRSSDVERVINHCERVDAGHGGPAMHQRSVQLAAALTRASTVLGEVPSGDGLRARDVARLDLPPIFPTESLARAAELMRANGVRALPVLDHGILVGLLAKTDLDPFWGHEEWTTVALAMSHEPATVAPDVRLADVARVLRDRGFDAVPVVVEGIVLGMAGRRDLLVALSDSTVRRGTR
jgi:CBS domain-containing protein